MSKRKTDAEPLPISYWYAYLAKMGVPKHTVQMIQIAMIQDAVTQGKDLKYDRIYTGIALMLHKTFGFGTQRIMKGLHGFDDICGSVLEDTNGPDERQWTDIMQELKDATGIVIHTGDDNRLVCEISRE